jgi:phosphatidylserine decarboxylase
MTEPDSFAFHRHPLFLKSYGLLPHRLLNRSLAWLTGRTRPAWAVEAAISTWSRLADIQLGDFEQRRYASVDDFFLRRLAPGARPLGDGFVSPADGLLIASGVISGEARLPVKGRLLSIDRVVNGRRHDVDLSRYQGGLYAVVFLTPRGYHRVHMPVRGVLRAVRFIPGRFFPQNPVALEHIPGVYERNERALLSFTSAEVGEFLLVMVGASLIGGIHLEAMSRAQWVGARPVTLNREYQRGDEIGHFAFGSTVVVLLPRGQGATVTPRDEIEMGQTLFNLTP